MASQAVLGKTLVRDVYLPNLTFPDVQLGKKVTPWDLRPLLYRGGASANAREVARLIDAGKLRSPVIGRINLVQKIHEEITAALVGGRSKYTMETKIERIRQFFGWADASGHSLSSDDIATTFVHWSDHLLHRIRVVKDLSESTAYASAMAVGGILDMVLERASPLLFTTRLTKPPKRNRIRGVEADKQNLTDTFIFGHALLDIIDALHLDTLWGPLPVRIRIRTGHELEEWSGLIPPATLRRSPPKTPQQRYAVKRSNERRTAYETDRTVRTRHPLVNLRIDAELLIFIGQTGMNLAQAHQLKFQHYSYKSTIDGYEVRDYKKRRQGEVLFEIFSEYKEVFERYLAWRRKIFPNDTDGLLFPFVRKFGRAEDAPPRFDRITKSCKKLGLPFITPSQLRNTRVNWLLRRSRAPELTAELAQHSKQTLLRIYEEPSLQVAMTEINRFWQTSDPALPSPAPGVCDGAPVPMVDIPVDTPKPDCIRPSGCLWCERHRDIDSQDYVWSVASMRHLKTLAPNGFKPPQDASTNEPARHVGLTIDRLTAKLHWLSNQMNYGAVG